MQDGHVPRQSVVLQRLYPTLVTLKVVDLTTLNERGFICHPFRADRVM